MLSTVEAHRRQRHEDAKAYARRWFAAREPIEQEQMERERQAWIRALVTCLRRCV